MKLLVSTLLSSRLRVVLIAFSSLVAALTIALNTVVLARVAHEYLSGIEVDAVMDLAKALYRLKQEELSSVACRLASDKFVVQNLPLSRSGDARASHRIDEQIVHKIGGAGLAGTHLVMVLDADGHILAGRVLRASGELSPPIVQGDWSALPIVAGALASGTELAATEIIPAELLAQVGLEEQARIELLETPLAAPTLFDPREGTGGLVMVALCPVETGGAVLVAHLFNNDFTLVDQIKEVGGIDTVTVFLGDLRVSTNVLDAHGKRALGTRISQAVRETVLEKGQPYVGRAYVVKEWFVTRYEPLYNHQGQVVGSLYVGTPESAFLGLVRLFNERVAFIALVPGILAALIAVPITHAITAPISELVEAHRRLARGDMTVRVQARGSGELATLARSFNSMAETLHKTQQELLHKERLASMGQLAAGVAHEINNPLGTILLFAEAMYKELSQAGDTQHCRDLQVIIEETTRCKNIVADLLNFARQQEVLAQETDLHGLLEQVIAEAKRRPLFAEVEIVCHFDPNLPTIQADAAQLRQVFINLLNNGAEAMDGRGTITLTTHARGDQIEVQVSDTGCGIPEEHLSKLFTPFFTTKPPGKGTGLGLSIVYGIVKMHHGQITVSSKVGEGTTFSVFLPVRLPQGNARYRLTGGEDWIG
ncbi:MAG: cache domain-containing protein [Anaerolineae bacterium]|nr:cache domain-containing protein [Anaerolineae bacterium]